MAEDKNLYYIEKYLWTIAHYLDDLIFQDVSEQNYPTKLLAFKLIDTYYIQQTLNRLKNIKHPLKNDILKLLIILDKHIQHVLPKLHWSKDEKKTQILRLNNMRSLLQQKYVKTLENYAAQLSLENQLSNNKNSQEGEKQKSKTNNKKIVKNHKYSDRYDLIGALLELHRFGTDKPLYEPLTSKEIEEHLKWNQPKVSREMEKLFGEKPMQKYKQCFSRDKKLSGYVKKLEDGTYDIDGITS